MKNKFKNTLLASSLIMSIGLLAACSLSKTNHSTSTGSSSSVTSSSSLKATDGNRNNKTMPSKSRSTSTTSISQKEMINLLSAWIENKNGMYEVRHFINNAGNETYIFINGGKNGTGKNIGEGAPSGLELKNEQNSVQFIIKGNQISFQIPNFPNGISGSWSEISWRTKSVLSFDQLKNQFYSKTSVASKQVISVSESSPY